MPVFSLPASNKRPSQSYLGGPVNVHSTGGGGGGAALVALSRSGEGGGAYKHMPPRGERPLNLFPWGCIHRRVVTQKTKSFALTYSQLRISLVFTPTLGFPNTWFSSPQFGGFFCIFSLWRHFKYCKRCFTNILAFMASIHRHGETRQPATPTNKMPLYICKFTTKKTPSFRLKCCSENGKPVQLRYLCFRLPFRQSHYFFRYSLGMLGNLDTSFRQSSLGLCSYCAERAEILCVLRLIKTYFNTFQIKLITKRSFGK